MNDSLTLALILFSYMSLWFIVSLLKKRNDVADVAWGLGFVLLAWSNFWKEAMVSLFLVFRVTALD